MKTLKLNSIETIKITGNTLTLEGLWYYHNYDLNTIRINYNFNGDTYWITINDTPYYKVYGKSLPRSAYDFITTAMRELHENSSLKRL